MVNYHENVYVRRGADGRGHIPALPFWMAIIRVVQLIFAFIVLVLAAYAYSTLKKDSGYLGSYVLDNYFPGFDFSFFAFAWTVVFFLYLSITPLVYPKFYHSYAHLPLEFLTVLWWLVTFALLADRVKYFEALQNSLEDSKHIADEVGVEISSGTIDNELAASKCARAATGLACIVWLLFMVTFGFVLYFWNKHRVEHGGAGLPFGSNRGDAEAPHVEKHAATELQNVQHHLQQPTQV